MPCIDEERFARKLQYAVNLSKELAQICREIAAKQERFLTARGITPAQARALGSADREALNADWAIWAKHNH